MAKIEAFKTGEEIKYFAKVQADAARINAELRILKKMAAATVGDNESVVIDGVELVQKKSTRNQFSKDVLAANWGADVYELCKVPTVCTSYEVEQ